MSKKIEELKELMDDKSVVQFVEYSLMRAIEMQVAKFQDETKKFEVDMFAGEIAGLSVADFIVNDLTARLLKGDGYNYRVTSTTITHVCTCLNCGNQFKVNRKETDRLPEAFRCSSCGLQIKRELKHVLKDL